MLLYLINVHGREHERLFGSEAFYDLDLSGRREELPP